MNPAPGVPGGLQEKPMPVYVVVRRRGAPPGTPSALEAVRGFSGVTVTGSGDGTDAVLVEADPEAARGLAVRLAGDFLVEPEILHDPLGN